MRCTVRPAYPVLISLLQYALCIRNAYILVNRYKNMILNWIGRYNIIQELLRGVVFPHFNVNVLFVFIFIFYFLFETRVLNFMTRLYIILL